MNTPALVDYAPALRLLALAGLLALLPLSWVWLRQRGANTAARLAALTALTLFLTFDLVVFGAFTRLTDSGLGCPDWPGCYAQASPLAAHEEIHAAQAAAPGGPVSWSKAWIEMIHRYLAMTVGALILVLTAAAWSERRRLPLSPWWPTLSLAWVVVQGLFGRYTVTLKLYPAVVTLHLLGGLVLLALLALQHARLARRALVLPADLRRWAWVAMLVLAVQVALGGWVSTNYAVLACAGLPQCNGQWWPEMDFGNGFTLLRGLGQLREGQGMTAPGLVAVHITHRLFALLAALVLGGLAWRLWRAADGAALRRMGAGLGIVLLVQLGTGMANVVLGWPLTAAVAHSAGAAALVLLLTLLLARSSARVRRAAAAA
jgi:cytochrome c oxidase assembly protein subunit 15